MRGRDGSSSAGGAAVDGDGRRRRVITPLLARPHSVVGITVILPLPTSVHYS